MEQPAIQAVDLTKRYDMRVRRITSAVEFRTFFNVLSGKKERSLVALNKVNLTIAPGQVFGLIGPNGAGKTTLIKILSTLVLPDSGHAFVYGTDVAKEPRAVLKKLQTVLAEHFGFERRLTGRQNLEFYATLYGIPRDEAKRRINALLEFCQLTEVADEMFQKYSSGMTRKLLVSRALLTDAAVLLLDEPTTGLDPASAADFKRFMKNVLVRERGKTLVWATHNLFEAEQVCDSIGLLKKGEMVARGSPREIRATIADEVSITIGLQGPAVESRAEWLGRLSSTSGVVSLETRQGVDSSNLYLDIKCTKDVDYNKIFETITGLGLKITGLEASQPTLEEAFVRLTRGERA